MSQLTDVTDVRPFSNSSDADYWRWRNCERCTKRGEPDARGIGPCAITDQVDTARGIGFCHMPKECAELDLVMVCEAITDRRKRSKPKCGALATGVMTDGSGYRHPVCETCRKRIERMDLHAARSSETGE